MRGMVFIQRIQTISKNHGQPHPHLGGQRGGRYIHITMVTWSDAGESAMPLLGDSPASLMVA